MMIYRELALASQWLFSVISVCDEGRIRPVVLFSFLSKEPRESCYIYTYIYIYIYVAMRVNRSSSIPVVAVVGESVSWVRVGGMELLFENYSYGLRLASFAYPMAILIKELVVVASIPISRALPRAPFRKKKRILGISRKDKYQKRERIVPSTTGVALKVSAPC
ncbi:hypothetical protein M9H77_36263 [Catharanthus roseus]|uniref:Uncharacterized protein n=1 Tax=Catharanthus roseus TaxID=4058 RepID=A0ACB9ZTB1_CATRO|nr:hypothetical protein M9H77_36263 [Catharanthus roseus]